MIAEALDNLAMPEEMREAVREAVASLVALAHPDVILLFGSWAEGRAQADSDVDIVLVAPAEDRWELARRFCHDWHQSRHALPALPPADILVYTPPDFEDSYLIGFPAYNAVRHGVVLYGQLPEFCLQMAACRDGVPV